MVASYTREARSPPFDSINQQNVIQSMGKMKNLRPRYGSNEVNKVIRIKPISLIAVAGCHDITDAMCITASKPPHRLHSDHSTLVRHL